MRSMGATLKPVTWAAWILVALATLALLYFARDFFITLLVGIVLSYVLRPAVEMLVHARLPRTLAALVVVLVAVGAVGTAMYRLADDASELLETLPKAARTVRHALQDGRAEQPAAISKVQEAASELDKAAAAASGRRAPANPTPTTPSFGERLQEYFVATGLSFFYVLGQALFAVLLAWYLLSEGDTFKRKMLAVVGPSLTRRKVTVRILEDIDRQIQRHMLAMCVANVLIGITTALAFKAIGLEQAALWGAIAGVLHFIPYVGQAIVTAGSTAAAYLQFGTLGPAAAVLATTLAISILIGTILITWLQSRASRVNTTVLFVALLFFGWLWGAWGLILASPVVAIVKSVCDHVPSFAPAAAFLTGDRNRERLEPATHSAPGA